MRSARENSLHDAGLGRPAHLRPLHQPRREAALLLPALPGKPDPRSLRLRRHADLDQKQSEEYVSTKTRVGTAASVTSRPPYVRSAAQASAAAMGSGFREGQLRRISSLADLSARLSRVTVAEIRVPVAQSSPPRTFGLLSKNSCSATISYSGGNLDNRQ